MAKSKSGGSRSRLRGRLANDVYSIGVDGKGKRQQIVRSLAESVANPRTLAQNKQRMILTSVALLSKALSPIIDHSFDGVPAGQPSISEFTRRAIAAYREDAQLASPCYGYSPYKGVIAPNCLVPISSGKAKFNVQWGIDCYNQYSKYYSLVAAECIPFYADGSENPYLEGQDFLNVIFGGSLDNYLTLVGIAVDNRDNPTKSFPIWVRIQPKSLDALIVDRDKDVLTKDSFNIETNLDPAKVHIDFMTGKNMKGDGYHYLAIVYQDSSCIGISASMVLSKKVGGGYQHSSSFLDNRVWGTDPDGVKLDEPIDYGRPLISYANALATYPLGEEKFLNGGDL